MKSIILISGAVIFLMILFFAMGYLKKLRKAFDHADVKNFSGTDAERIVNAYRTEEGYLKRRTRVWLLTIALEAAVVLTTFGSVYYLANKDRWAAERELAQAQKEQKSQKIQDRTENLAKRIAALQEKQQAAAEGLSLRVFRYKQRRLEAVQERLDEAIADYWKARRELDEAQKQDILNNNLLKNIGSLIAGKDAVSKAQIDSLEKVMNDFSRVNVVALEKNFVKARLSLADVQDEEQYLQRLSADGWKYERTHSIMDLVLLSFIGMSFITLLMALCSDRFFVGLGIVFALWVLFIVLLVLFL